MHRTTPWNPILYAMLCGCQMSNGAMTDYHHLVTLNYQHVLVFSFQYLSSDQINTEILLVVCLERMDESVDGVLTILCNHAFHANCLIKWGDSTCPVCRCVQTPELAESSVCMECEGTEALWICLICGHVGCGRFVLIEIITFFYRRADNRWKSFASPKKILENKENPQIPRNSKNSLKIRKKILWNSRKYVREVSTTFYSCFNHIQIWSNIGTTFTYYLKMAKRCTS